MFDQGADELPHMSCSVSHWAFPLPFSEGWTLIADELPRVCAVQICWVAENVHDILQFGFNNSDLLKRGAFLSVWRCRLSS